MTLADVAPLVIVTNDSVVLDAYLSEIVAVVGSVVEEETSSTENVAWLPLITT